MCSSDLRLRPSGSPILDLHAPKHKTRDHQRKALDELAFLNQRHAKKHPEHADLAARMESYELAYRMQMEVPGVIDLKSEPEHIREAYGMNQKETAAFGRQCLMARRLVRSEEHTSELQSRTNLVCRLLLEKKKFRPAALLSR